MKNDHDLNGVVDPESPRLHEDNENYSSQSDSASNHVHGLPLRNPFDDMLDFEQALVRDISDARAARHVPGFSGIVESPISEE